MSQLNDEKLFYERFYALHNDPVLVEIVKKFGIGVFRRSSVLEGFEEFIKRIGFSGGTCLEIGTCNGLTALVLARHFKKVITVDISRNDIKREIANQVGAYNIDFVEVRDNDEKSVFVDSVTFDAAYVDGNHQDDTDTDFALVEKCGNVLFHEYWNAQPSVVRLVDSLKGTKIYYGKFARWTR